VRQRRRDLAAREDAHVDARSVEQRLQRPDGALDTGGVEIRVRPVDWGVATIVVMPSARARRASETASSIVAGPSSTPGRTWQWRSITPPMMAGRGSGDAQPLFSGRAALAS
jgi:hypothetical protein